MESKEACGRGEAGMEKKRSRNAVEVQQERGSLLLLLQYYLSVVLIGIYEGSLFLYMMNIALVV